MKTLNFKQMEKVDGGFSIGCAAAIASGVLFVASLFIVPVGAAAIAFYAASATVGPTLVGVGIGTACS